MVVEHEHRHDAIGVARGARERRVVSDAEVAAEPVNESRHGDTVVILGSRSAVILSERRSRTRPGENLVDRAPSIVEDLLELAAHAEPVDESAERTEGERVVDVIVA